MRPKILLDECISPKVARRLGNEGFRVTTCLRCGLLGKSDDEVMAYAVRRGYALVTKNRRDFEEQHGYCADGGVSHAGILIINDYTTEEVFISLRAFLLQTEHHHQLFNLVVYL